MSTSRPVRVDSEVQELLRISAGALAAFRRRIPSAVLDELCQEAAVRTFQAEGVEDSGAFVYRVARRLGLDWLRRRRELAWDMQVERTGDARWQDAVECRLDIGRVQQALGEAPEAYRSLIEALYFRYLDLEDLIREELGTRGGERDYVRARDVVYKRRNRAIGWLRRRLGT